MWTNVIGVASILVAIRTRLRRTGNVIRIGVERNAYSFKGKPEERVHMKVMGIDGTIVLKWILKEWDGMGRLWIGLIWFRIETNGAM
jgi:hypothetical protein